MADYLATFFTHYDAIKFVRDLKKHGVTAQLAPVPRRLSSSCGTCAKFSFPSDPLAIAGDQFEFLARAEGEDFLLVADHR